MFGATNQVLAAFTLLMCALYLRTIGRRAVAYAMPAVFVMSITIIAMVLQIARDLSSGHYMVGGVGLIIGIVTIWIAIEGALAWRRVSPNRKTQGS